MSLRPGELRDVVEQNINLSTTEDVRACEAIGNGKDCIHVAVDDPNVGQLFGLLRRLGLENAHSLSRTVSGGTLSGYVTPDDGETPDLTRDEMIDVLSQRFPDARITESHAGDDLLYVHGIGEESIGSFFQTLRHLGEDTGNDLTRNGDELFGWVSVE